MKFKTGDKVQLNEDGIIVHNDVKHGDKVNLYEIKGTVTEIRSSLKYPIYVKWDKFFNNEYCYGECELDFLDESIIDVDELFSEIKL